MKKIYFVLAIFLAHCASMNAQIAKTIAPASFFDPEHDPVALRSDTSLQLIVSEYVLIKSVTARLGQSCRVTKTYKSKLPNGQECLVFEGAYFRNDQQRFSMAIILSPDSSGRYYYTSNQALVCEQAGCNNCSISNGKCIGCCDPSSNSSMSAPNYIAVPLLKVPTSID